MRCSWPRVKCDDGRDCPPDTSPLPGKVPSFPSRSALLAAIPCKTKHPASVNKRPPPASHGGRKRGLVSGGAARHPRFGFRRLVPQDRDAKFSMHVTGANLPLRFPSPPHYTKLPPCEVGCRLFPAFSQQRMARQTDHAPFSAARQHHHACNVRASWESQDEGVDALGSSCSHSASTLASAASTATLCELPSPRRTCPRLVVRSRMRAKVGTCSLRGSGRAVMKGRVAAGKLADVAVSPQRLWASPSPTMDDEPDLVAGELDEDLLLRNQMATLESDTIFALVVDGYGGSACADFVQAHLPAAVAVAADAVPTTACANGSALGCMVPHLITAFRYVDEAFQAEVRARPEENHAGACATMALVREDEFVLAQCGDCSALLCIDGKIRPFVPYCADGCDWPREGPVAGSIGPHSTPLIFRGKLGATASSSSPSFLVVASASVWAHLDAIDACFVVARALMRHGDEDTAARVLLSLAKACGADADMSAAVLAFVPRLD